MSDTQLDLGARLKFLGIGDTECAAICEAKPVIAAHLQEILSQLYADLMAVPETAATIGDPGRIPHLQAAQTKHWLYLFDANFDAAYVEKALAIGQAHERIGLAPSWYIGTYNLAYSRMVPVLVDAFRKHPDKLSTVISAVGSALMMDMEIAVSVYISQGEARRRADMAKVADDLEREVKSAVEQTEIRCNEVREASNVIVAAVTAVGDRANAVSSASAETTGNIGAVAVATEQLSASEREIATEVLHSATVVREAVEQTRQTGATIEGLAQAGQQISDVAKLISEIASQTNLLALNATIEAARAGEAGKGFAVVAGEVKNLAAQTAKATDEIAANINAIQTASKEAVSAIGDIDKTIRQVEETTTTISAAVEEQSAATGEIGRNIDQGAQSTREVSDNAVEVARDINEAGRICGSLNDTSAAMSDAISFLRNNVDGLLTQLRAG